MSNTIRNQTEATDLSRNAWNRHLQEVDETYVEHFVNASGFGLSMIGAGFACLIHAVVPCAFVKTGSRAITDLHDRMVTHRAK